MLIALDKDNNRVIASRAEKDIEYFCQECNEKVDFRKGKVRRSYFAHKRNSECWASCNKTEWHYEWQEAFGLDNSEKILEFAGFKHIADTIIGDVVIEFQHSNIEPEDIAERNFFYNSFGLDVVWIFDIRQCYEKGNLQAYKTISNYERMIEWQHPKKYILRALDRGNVLLQVNDNWLIEIVWYPNGYTDEYGDYWSRINKFRGRMFPKHEFIKKTKTHANFEYKPKQICDASSFRENIEMCRKGIIA